MTPVAREREGRIVVDAAPATSPGEGRPLVHRMLEHSLLRYLVIGGLSFVVDFGTLYAVHGVLRVWLPAATVTAYLMALAVNFGLNRLWAFGGAAATAVGRQLARYLFLVAVNIAVTALVVPGLAALGVQYLAAKVIATAGLVVVNYVAYRTWVFGRSAAAAPETGVSGARRRRRFARRRTSG
ncbi:GtrA family protein [Actinomadura sp. 9N407]|uniref:GtrA family protein n=1 Tax=Actinomadura sp. 9N407 TaxID=3375154 RepID=UPI00378815E7